MSVQTCFQSIIGYTRKSDDCVLEDWDDSYSESDSGLYIDELPGFPQRFVDALGGNTTLWEKMDNSLDNAIRAFKVDVISAILKYKEASKKRFKGDIGGKSFTNILADCAYQGLRMYSDVNGGTFTLRGITIILDTTETITLNIYDEYDLLYSFDIVSEAGKPSYNVISPLELSLKGNYYFLYSSIGSAYNNKLTCNCGGFKWCFDIESPCIKPSRENWSEWAMMGGVCGDDINDRDDWGIANEARGLILHGDFNCDIFGSLCSDHSDWVGNEIDFAIANAIWYKSGEFLSVYVLDSEEISRPVLLGIEQWKNNGAHYAERYQAMIDFIADNFEEECNECLKCRNPFGYEVQSQFL